MSRDNLQGACRYKPGQAVSVGGYSNGRWISTWQGCRFSAKRNLELLRRTRQSVPDGARLLLADFWTDATHTQPTFAALMAGEFLVITGEGDVYSAEEVQGWLQETGWRLLERKPLAGPQSVIVAETTQ